MGTCECQQLTPARSFAVFFFFGQRLAEPVQGKDTAEPEQTEQADEADGTEDEDFIEKSVSQGSTSNSDEQQQQEDDHKRHANEQRPVASAGKKKASKDVVNSRKTGATTTKIRPRSAKSVQAEQ
jgi:hypothetical protein